MKNNGDGTFATAVNYDAGDASSVFCADLDGDLDADLAIANRDNNNVSILKNNGDGTYGIAVNYSVGKAPLSVFCSDLDGDLNDQFEAQKAGSILLIHVHGDNISTIKDHVDNIRKNDFIFTTQTEPLPGSYNFYGFTDGDRAVCMSTLMKVKEIILSGFDFGPVIGKYSKQYQLDEELKKRKMKKFLIAKSIINWCANTEQKISKK